MKTTLIIRSAIILCLAICLGCSKDSDNGDIVLIDYGTMKAKVSGLTTIPNNTVIDFEPNAINIIDDRIRITGGIKGSYTAQLSFQIPLSIIEPGVYEESIGGYIAEGWSCDPGYVGENCGLQYLHNFHSSHNEVTLTITQLNEERMEGTFKVVECGLYNQVNIDDGYFNILRE